MGTEKRERKKAGRQAKLAAERAAAQRAQRIRAARNMAIFVVFVVVALILISSLTGCGSSSTSGSSTTAGCPPATGAPHRTKISTAPLHCLDVGKHYTAIIHTTEGTVTVPLDTTRTPQTTSNFVALARWHYFDGTRLFRTEKQSGIIQGGSPHTQDATDPGPGYTIPDEGGTFTPADYRPGTLAMGRTQEPDSAGAQFFFLANENGRYLGDPSQPGGGTYVVFGHATKGFDVLQRISGLDDGTSQPRHPVTVTSITIVES